MFLNFSLLVSGALCHTPVFASLKGVAGLALFTEPMTFDPEYYKFTLDEVKLSLRMRKLRLFRA